MLQSIRQLKGKTLRTTDGEIGNVKDCYFNDQQSAFRYVIADTGSWLLERLVLISPNAFGEFREDEDCLLVNLTKQQIENSPAIESDKPVSRQYEEEYNHYYGWPSYWVGGGMWGVGAFPATDPMAVKETTAAGHNSHQRSGDPNLRSTLALSGYHIQTSEGAIGHVTDSIMDDRS